LIINALVIWVTKGQKIILRVMGIFLNSCQYLKNEL
jgi:hypothetical protein